jgi:HEAT repeat protein
MDERAPADGIRRHREVIGPLSDDELIARIEGLKPLPDADDDDPAWLEDATWARAGFLLAAADWQLLTAIMRPMTRDQRAGCRRWAVRELGILRDPQALDDLVAALGDEEPLVRSEACTSLAMLSQAALHARPQIWAPLQATAEHDPSSEVRRHAQWAIDMIA